jgi:hypothetical protein
MSKLFCCSFCETDELQVNYQSWQLSNNSLNFKVTVNRNSPNSRRLLPTIKKHQQTSTVPTEKSWYFFSVFINGEQIYQETKKGKTNKLNISSLKYYINKTSLMLLHTYNLSVLWYIRRVAASTKMTTQLFRIYYKTVKIRQYCRCFDLQIKINTSFLPSVLILWDKVTWHG